MKWFHRVQEELHWQVCVTLPKGWKTTLLVVKMKLHVTLLPPKMMSAGWLEI